MVRPKRKKPVTRTHRIMTSLKLAPTTLSQINNTADHLDIPKTSLIEAAILCYCTLGERTQIKIYKKYREERKKVLTRSDDTR